MIYPATYNIAILQNATWRASFRVTQNRQTLENVTVSGGTVFLHWTAMVFLLVTKQYSLRLLFPLTSLYVSIEPSPASETPCGLALNTVYYVIASGLTANSFYVAATSGGTAIAATGAASGTFYVAQPVSLSGYTIDSDVRQILTGTQVATFTPSIVDNVNGQFQLVMAPAVSSGIEAGRYNYDVSLTQPNGDRFYWLTGIATVSSTYSR
jgi:hypothetical protein